MTATDELRRMLDERGVEWGANDTYRLLVTSWKDAGGHSWAFTEHKDGSFSKLTAYHLTPAQAIAATLGAVEYRKPKTLSQLEAENSKLRELVRFIMHQCNEGNPRCDECIGWNDGECVALLRMRELGVAE